MESSGDRVNVSNLQFHPIQSTPKNATSKRRMDYSCGDFDESIMVEEMKNLCSGEKESTDDITSSTESEDIDIEEYKKMIATDEYWSSKLRSQRLEAKRRCPISSINSLKCRRRLAHDDDEEEEEVESNNLTTSSQ